MNASHLTKNAYDVLLKVTSAEGHPKITKEIIDHNMVFEGVFAGTPFFVGDEISFRYRDEFGPRRFEAKVLTSHPRFTELSSLIDSSVDEM